MAFGEMNFFSESLGRNVSFHFLIPGDREMDRVLPHCNRPPKTLYLLHGYSHTSHDWLLSANLTKLAMRYNFNVVLPNGENSFYLDQKSCRARYTQFVGQELVDYTRKIFGFSSKREDNFIAGESMGGFGALHVGLAYPETFSKIAAFSPAMVQHEVAAMQPGTGRGLEDYDYYLQRFGEPSMVLQSENNPEYQILRLQQQSRAIPEMFVCCGTEDSLLQPVRDWIAFLEQHQAPVRYQESPGEHDFDFWNPYLEPVLKFFLE